MVSSPSALAASSRCRHSTTRSARRPPLLRLAPADPVENAGRELVYSLLLEGRTTPDRNVDVGDWDGLALHHDWASPNLREFYAIP